MQPQTLQSSRGYARISNLPSQKRRNNMNFNQAAAYTEVQQKLCPKFKFHLLQNLLKFDLNSGSRRHCGPAGAMPEFQISPFQQLKNMNLNHAAAVTAQISISISKT